MADSLSSSGKNRWAKKKIEIIGIGIIRIRIKKKKMFESSATRYVFGMAGTFQSLLE